MPENVTTRVGLFYKQTSGNTVEFSVKLVLDSAISGDPYLQNATSKCSGGAKDTWTLQEISAALPTSFSQDEQFALENGSGYWTAPGEGFFHVFSATPRVSGAVYGTEMSFTWAQGGMSGGGGASYEFDVLPPDPATLPGYEKHEEGTGTYFMPPKGAFVQSWSLAAHSDFDDWQAWAYVQWACIYAGQELPPEHIWRLWNVGYFFAAVPFVKDTLHPAECEYYKNPANGYVVTTDWYGDQYDVEVEIFSAPSTPFLFYPDRSPDEDGTNTGDSSYIPVHGLPTPANILGAWRPRFSKNLEVPFIFESLTARGDPLTAEGEPLEARK